MNFIDFQTYAQLKRLELAADMRIANGGSRRTSFSSWRAFKSRVHSGAAPAGSQPEMFDTYSIPQF